MSVAQAALFGALIGGFFALAGSAITNMVALRNERLRRESTEAQARIEALRTHAAVAFGQLFVAQHALEWLTWHATHDPNSVDQVMVKTFDDEIHNAYPKLIGAMTMVASISVPLYQAIRPSVKRLYVLEGKVARVIRQIDTEASASIEVLASYLQEAVSMESELPEELGRIMADAEAAI